MGTEPWLKCSLLQGRTLHGTTLSLRLCHNGTGTTSTPDHIIPEHSCFGCLSFGAQLMQSCCTPDPSQPLVQPFVRVNYWSSHTQLVQYFTCWAPEISCVLIISHLDTRE